jgi:tetratricopeptide (TPR) repeat protein
VRHAFSLCLQRLDRPVEALRNIDELLAKHPDLAFAHATRGNALMYLGRPTQAGRSHLRALEIDPGNLVALSALSSLATQRGEYEGARRWAQAARLVSPTHPQALTSLAAAELANGAVTPAESLLEQVILGSHATPVERARATGLLGDVLQAQGRYAEAFNAYTTCNETLRTIYHRLARRTGALAQIRALIASTNSIGIAQAKSIPEAAPVELRGHVFVLDFPGSGKTPLERLLESHPRVSTIDEHELPEREEGCRLPELRTAYWNAVADLGIETAGKVLVDRHPLNTLQLPLIARLFPRAKILFVCRDPRQAVLDCFRYGFAKNAQLYDLLTLSGAAVFYEAAMRFIDRVGPQLGLDWHVLRPEIVDSGLEEGSRAMFDFLGLDRLVDLNHSVGTGQLPGSWTYYEAHLQPIFPAIKTWVGSLGYRL